MEFWQFENMLKEVDIVLDSEKSYELYKIFEERKNKEYEDLYTTHEELRSEMKSRLEQIEQDTKCALEYLS